MKEDSRARRGTVLGIERATFYRQIRAFHGYLSALSFIVLMAFAATGILLNHPNWTGDARPASSDRKITLAKDELAAALSSPSPPQALAAKVATRTAVRGAYKAGEIASGEAQLRFEGVSGTTDVSVDLDTGEATVGVVKANVLQILNDLHRGKNAGQAWGLIIDISGILIFLMSALGYIIFLSLRFRMRTAFALTALSLLLLVGVYATFVP